MNDEVVKLVQNAAVKELLQEATKTNRIIEVDESSFMVRNTTNKKVVFRGIKIRNNCWGITFSKHTNTNQLVG